jgi:hypothetical protein
MTSAEDVPQPSTSQPAETSRFENFLESKVSARLETSAQLAPLVFRRTGKRKLEYIRSSAVYKTVQTLEEINRRKNPLFSNRTTHLFGSPSPVRTRLSTDGTRPGEDPQGSQGNNPASGGVHKVGKNQVSGKPFTSRFRGVHRTIPTKRWEAQFRKDGKPTSLGCFDTEESAAKAYDKMMLWCELHNKNLGKQSVMNFPTSHYNDDVPWLMEITQDALLLQLRKEGRAEAALKRAHAQKAAQNTGQNAPPAALQGGDDE